jgi:hypothetical protein
MFHLTIRDLVWLMLLLLMAGAWWWDRSGLANNLKNCRFVLEQQRATIAELSDSRAKE